MDRNILGHELVSIITFLPMLQYLRPLVYIVALTACAQATTAQGLQVSKCTIFYVLSNAIHRCFEKFDPRVVTTHFQLIWPVGGGNLPSTHKRPVASNQPLPLICGDSNCEFKLHCYHFKGKCSKTQQRASFKSSSWLMVRLGMRRHVQGNSFLYS